MAKKEKMLDDSKVLSSVKLVDGGCRGVVISYTDVENVSAGVSVMNIHKGVRFGRAANAALVNGFGGLSGHLLDICGYPLDGPDRKVLDANVEVTGVTYSVEKGFIISGVLSVLGGKMIVLNTPLLQNEGDFVGYDEVVGKLDALYVDTRNYLNDRSVDLGLMLEMQNKRAPIKVEGGFTLDMFSGLTEGEQTKFAANFLENKGVVILAPPEVEEEMKEAKSVTFDRPILEAPKSVKKPKLEVTVSDDDDFGISEKSEEEQEEDADFEV